MRFTSAQIGTTLAWPAETSFEKRKRAYNLLQLLQGLCFGDDRTWLKRRGKAAGEWDNLERLQHCQITSRFWLQASEKTAIGLPFLHLQSHLGRQDESGKTWIQQLKGESDAVSDVTLGLLESFLSLKGYDLLPPSPPMMAHLLSLGTQSKDATRTLKRAGESASHQWKRVPGTERGIATSSVALLCKPEHRPLMSVLTGRCTCLAVLICQRSMLLLYSPCGVNNHSCRNLKPQPQRVTSDIYGQIRMTHSAIISQCDGWRLLQASQYPIWAFTVLI